MVGETFNPPGHWSSFPPHKHDGKNGEPFLEEVYHFRVSPAHGFGHQMLYTEDGESVTHQVRDGDAVLLPYGYHPVSSPPGYSLVLSVGHGRRPAATRALRRSGASLDSRSRRRQRAAMTRFEVVQQIETLGVVAVIRLQDPARLRAVVDAIAAGGVRALEVTMTVPRAIEMIAEIAPTLPNGFLIGAGTVLDKATVNKVDQRRRAVHRQPGVSQRADHGVARA